MKQYLMMCTDEIKTQLESVFKSVEFLEVQGMNLNGENKLCVLVTPVLQPLPTANTPPQTTDNPVAVNQMVTDTEACNNV